MTCPRARIWCHEWLAGLWDRPDDSLHQKRGPAASGATRPMIPKSSRWASRPGVFLCALRPFLHRCAARIVVGRLPPFPLLAQSRPTMVQMYSWALRECAEDVKIRDEIQSPVYSLSKKIIDEHYGISFLTCFTHTCFSPCPGLKAHCDLCIVRLLANAVVFSWHNHVILFSSNFV